MRDFVTSGKPPLTTPSSSLLALRFRVMHLEPQGWAEQFAGGFFALNDWIEENADREWFEVGDYWRIEAAE